MFAELDKFIAEFYTSELLVYWKLLLTRILIIIYKGYFSMITLPIIMQLSSFSLIDNILCNIISRAVDSTSGLLINDTSMSNHKIIFFTHLPNDVCMNKVNTLKKKSEAFIHNFWNELGSFTIYEHLYKRLNLDPNDNYE